MAWTIEYDRRVVKELKKLDRKIQRAVLDFFDERVASLDDARSLGKPLSGKLAGLWRYRIGDYRAVCKIENEGLVVLVLRVRHRSSVYKVNV